MTWVAVAVGVGGAVVGAYGANKQANAAKQAGQYGADAASQANATELQMYNQSRQDAEPWRQAGNWGLQQYMALLGAPASAMQSGGAGGNTSLVVEGSDGVPVANDYLYQHDPAYRKAWDDTAAQHRAQWNGNGYWTGSDNDWIRSNVMSRLPSDYMDKLNQPTNTGIVGPQGTQDITTMLRNTPGYQFDFNEGQRALQSSAAANGGLFSGKAGKALVEYGQNKGDQNYQNALNRYGALAGVGQVQNQNNAAAGQSYAQASGTNLMNAANARASGLVGSANAWSNFGNQLTSTAGYLAGQYAGRR